MKLRTKLNIALVIVFGVLTLMITFITIKQSNRNIIDRAAESVRLKINSAWLIYNSKLEIIKNLAGFIAYEVEQANGSHEKLEQKLISYKERYGLDILVVTDSNGKVVYRTNPPYNEGDTIESDILINNVKKTHTSSSGTILLSEKRLLEAGDDLLKRCIEFGGEATGMFVGAAVPVTKDAEFSGIIEMGVLLNGSTNKVDRIRDIVFENSFYGGKPLGTATIFMGDMRISTNVMDTDGTRAIGTRVSDEVVDHVLKYGKSWTGRAWVVDEWYLSQYDPILDPEGKVIGMLYVGELEKKYKDLRNEITITYILVIFAVMSLAFIVFFFISKSVLKPVHRLFLATQKIAEGDLDYQVDGIFGGEIGALADSFNWMTRRLERQRRKIEKQKEELENINTDLRRINKNYMDMLGFVSHELKNPLASAVMSVYSVKDGYLGDLTPAQQKALNSVSRSLDYFEEMIKHYLDLSRIEKGEISCNISMVHLQEEIIEPVLVGLEGALKENKIEIVNKVPDELTLSVDKDLIRIVFSNLLSNAVKYGAESSTLTLDFKETPELVQFTVMNEGEGIPEDKIETIFKKFTRLDNPKYRYKKGTGLGLFICKKIIEKHNGKIWVESQVGAWTKFIFNLQKNIRSKDGK